MDNIKSNTIRALFWSFIDRFSSIFITFVIGIVLARLLGPEEFGLIGMLSIFMAISMVFIQSGFNQALIRKKDCSEEDFSTVFHFNLFVSIFLYVALILSSEAISAFYEEPRLTNIIRVFGVILVINALTIVQRTKIIKSLNFKLLTKISLISNILSGIVGIFLAFTGFGVWSLVSKQIVLQGTQGILLWYWSEWRPSRKFSKESFKELFTFSSNLVGLAIIDTIYKNIYYVIIGKFYPTANLGQYTKADQIKRIPSETLTNIIDRVSLPVLSSIQDNSGKFELSFNRILRSTLLLSCLLSVGLSAISKELSIVLMGQEWSLAGEYLNLLCFTALFFPINKLLYSVLKVLGDSASILRLGLMVKLFAIPVIMMGIVVGIKPMLYTLILQQIITTIVITRTTERKVGFSIFKKYFELFPTFLLSFTLYIFMISLGHFLNKELIIELLIKISVSTLLVLAFLEISKFNDYIYIKNSIKSLLSKN